MAMEQPARKNAKSSVGYVCGLLQSLGVKGLSPEQIRRAKFNHPSPAPSLLQALHDLVALNLASFPALNKINITSNNNDDNNRVSFSGLEAAEASSSSTSEKNGARTQKKKKQLKNGNAPAPRRTFCATRGNAIRFSSSIPPSKRRPGEVVPGGDPDSKGFLRSDPSATNGDARHDGNPNINGLSASLSSINHGHDEIGHGGNPKLGSVELGLSSIHGNDGDAQHCGNPNPNAVHLGNPNRNGISRLNPSSKHGYGEVSHNGSCNPNSSKYVYGKVENGGNPATNVLPSSKDEYGNVAWMEHPNPNGVHRVISLYDSKILNNLSLNSSLEKTSSHGENLMSISYEYPQQPAEDVEKKLAFVKFYMALWGYPNNSPLFALASNTQQSRPLLLAMAWFLSRFDVFKRILKCSIEPLLLSRSKAPLPPYPADVSCTNEALEMGREAEGDARAHVSKLLNSLDSIGDAKKRAAARAQQALMIYGKVKICIKSLHSLKFCKAKLIHELNELQIEKKVLHPVHRRPFSQYEVHLLQHKEDLVRHLEALQADKMMQQKIRELQKHVGLFQEWMESVVDMSVSESPISSGSTNELGVKKQLLHRKELQEHASKISHCGKRESSSTVSLEGIEGLSEAMAAAVQGLGMKFVEDTETVAAAQGKEGVSISEVQVIPHLHAEPISIKVQQTENENIANGRACTAPEEIQRLAQLAMAVNGILARTCNRTMLHEALEPILSDKSLLHFGL